MSFVVFVWFSHGRHPWRLFCIFELSFGYFVLGQLAGAPCKGIQDRLRFLIPGTGFQILVSGTWIPDSNC